VLHVSLDLADAYSGAFPVPPPALAAGGAHAAGGIALAAAIGGAGPPPPGCMRADVPCAIDTANWVARALVVVCSEAASRTVGALIVMSQQVYNWVFERG